MRTGYTGRPGQASTNRGAKTRWVLHVDLDQFIAAVEILRHPELDGLPVVVGGRGDPTERGVVSTASYAAREFGVGSGMPLRVALRKCPDAVFLPVDGPAYDEASGEVMATLRALEWGGVPVVLEVLGWDEAFLAADDRRRRGGGRSPKQHRPPRLGDPRDFAEEIKAAVLAGPGCTARSGSATTSCGPRSRPTSASRDPGSYVIPETLVRGDGSAAHRGAVGDRLQDLEEARRARHRHRRAAGALRRPDAGRRLGPTMGPWFHRLGRGADRARSTQPRGCRGRTGGRRRSRRTSPSGPTSSRRCAR